MSVINLIGSALSLTGQILKFVEDNRGWKIKKEIEDLLEEINEQEKMETHLQDNQLMDELHDTLTLKLSLFSSYLGTQTIQRKDN